MPKSVIVISGQPGAGSSTVAKLLAEKLHLPCFIVGRVFKDIALGQIEKNPHYQLIKQNCIKHGITLPTLSAHHDEEAVQKLWNTDIGKSLSFHEALDDTQRELAKKGNIVIDGKLSVHIIPKATIKVWLAASFSARAERHAQKNKISISEASRLLEVREEQERAEWQRMYGFDYLDQSAEADIVIDTTQKEPPLVVQDIIRQLESTIFKTAQKSL